MAELVDLGLTTAEGRPLMHKFYRQVEEAGALLALFPGAHYGVDGPLLYYPGELLKSAGWDTLALSYGFQTAVEEISSETVPGLLSECRQAVRAALDSRRYGRVGLVGKSLGCFVVAHLCRDEPGLRQARAVYLTPPLGNPFFERPFIESLQPAYLAVGTADRYYDPDTLEALLGERQFERRVVEGADHSMDHPGDLAASLQSVGLVVREAVAFLSAA